MPKFVPCLVVDKVRLVFVSVIFYSSVYVQQVPNKSHSQELNNVLFVVVVQMMGCGLCLQTVRKARPGGVKDAAQAPHI